jgi:hypothetical protein
MACPNCYDLGTAIVLTGTFTDPSNNPAEPGAVTLRVLDPNGVEQVITPSQVQAGVYQAAIDPLVPGVWFYRFEGTAPVDAAMEANFVVASSQFADAA